MYIISEDLWWVRELVVVLENKVVINFRNELLFSFIVFVLSLILPFKNETIQDKVNYFKNIFISKCDLKKDVLINLCAQFLVVYINKSPPFHR